MSHQQTPSGAGEPFPPIKVHSTSSPRVSSSSIAGETPTSGAARKIAIAVDLSDESAYAVKWAVDHYLRPGDAVVLLHVRPSSVRYGADWGSVSSADLLASAEEIGDSDESIKKLEDDFDNFTTSKAADLARPLIAAQVPYKIKIVKDHDMKERLCLEIERLGVDAVVMGSRGFGATRRETNDKLGSVSDYCLRHCSSPVVVVRCSDDKDGNGVDNAIVKVSEADDERVSEEEFADDASVEHKG